MTILSVNLNKVALIRNSRDTDSPKLAEFARLSIEHGAKGITVHPRPDQRHIRAQDCAPLSELVAAFPEVEFNIEGNPFAPAMASGRDDVADYPGFMELVLQLKPEQATLVPDGDEQLTSDHGFDLRKDSERLKPIVEQLQQAGIRVSLFMDPDAEQIRLAKQLGVERIELYTGPFAHAWAEGGKNAESVYQDYYAAAQAAQELGLGLNAGHDLDLHNLAKFSQVPALLEVSIGHELTLDALRMGWPEAIKAYLRCLA